MEFDSQKSIGNNSGFADYEVSELIEKYLLKWKWFALCLILSLIFAYFFIRYQVPLYESSATIFIKESESNQNLSEFTTFEDLGLTGSSGSSLENEIHLLTSRRLIKEVVQDLQLNVRYFVEDSPYNQEIFPIFPITLSLYIEEPDTIKPNKTQTIPLSEMYTAMRLTFDSKGGYLFQMDEGEPTKEVLGKPLHTSLGTFELQLNPDFQEILIGKTIIVEIMPTEVMVDVIKSKLVVEPIDERSRVLQIRIRETSKEKGIALISNLIEQYNLDAIEDKNQVFVKTTDFLNDRLNLITKELTVIESTAEQYRTRNQMIDANAGAQIFLQTSSANETELIQANTQLQMIDYMLEELRNNDNKDPLPVNIGLSDISITNLTGQFNELISRRNRIITSSSDLNPIIVSIDAQLTGLKENLTSSLSTLRSSAEIQVDALYKRGGAISSKIATVPKNEREFNDIVRQQETKNALYLFLLQKREESILSSSVKTNKAKIIDQPYSDGWPVSPKNKLVYLAALLLGFMLPVVVIYGKDLLDTKVHGEKDIRPMGIPYLGDIPLTNKKNEVYVQENQQSSIAEAFRYIRTNIGYMLGQNDSGQVILVTSTKGGEGKTVTSINLAVSLASSGKKVMLIAMDLRAPKVGHYLGIETKLGISNYIKDGSVRVQELIHKTSVSDKLDLILSGDIPPNPVELLMSERVGELFAYVRKQYDFVIVDTAPVGMVTDALQLKPYGDLTIYVVKANFLDKRMLNIPYQLYREDKLPQMSILINGSDHSKGDYGYGYGYGYGRKKEKSHFLKFFTKT